MPEEAEMDRRIPIGRAPLVNRQFWDTMMWKRRSGLHSIVTGVAVYVLKYDALLYLGIQSGSLRLGAGSEYEYEPCRLSERV